VEFLIVMMLLLGVMYVLMIRPQRRRQQEHQTMVESCGVGEDVLTTGGIYGTVTQAEGDDLVVEIADGISVHMTRRGIAAVLPPEDEADDVDDEYEDVVDADEPEDATQGEDEAPITLGEEAVRREVDADAAAADRR
jgi:preprotein translocase subunit YajC